MGEQARRRDLKLDQIVKELRSAPRVQTLLASALNSPNLRLDAKHYQEEFVAALARVKTSAYPNRPIGEVADAFIPGRIKLITVPTEGAGAPYLRAHDAFETRPESDRYVASMRVSNYDSLLLRKGMILTPSSGRNLGPVAYVGKYLSSFAMTDIMRIVPKSKIDGFYLLAYLLTETGQALVRKGRTGTTVDHLAPADVLSIPLIWLGARPDRVWRRVFIAA